jgi:Cu2+-exporting ATPase
MDHMTHPDREAADPHAGHKMSEAHASHDRHAGHSVAMFRDKFWLSFALTIPLVPNQIPAFVEKPWNPAVSK